MNDEIARKAEASKISYELAYFMEFGSYPKIKTTCKQSQPTISTFDEMAYLETNYNIYFEPSRRFHFYRF